MKRNNIDFLQWVYDRMLHVHNEDANFDYMLKFRILLQELRKTKELGITKVNTKEINKDAVDVVNFHGVLEYICQDVNRSINLTTYLKEQLTNIFGKHNTTFKGLEFYYYVWVLEFDNHIFNIYTAKRKGTQITIVANPDEDKKDICINFLKKFEKLILS